MNRQQFNAMVAQYGIENISGSDIVAWSSGVPCNVQSMKFYGKCEQSTTPTPDAPVEIKCNGGSYRYTSTGDSFDITVPELRAVGEYKDEWDYCTGKGIRRIGIKVLDGTEAWVKYHYSDDYSHRSWRIPIATFNEANSNIRAMCTHYTWTGYGNLFYGRAEALYAGGVSDGSAWLVIGTALPTLAEFKAFLAEQYANGTPVTVYYAMAEPQEFYDAGGSLSNLSGRIEPKNVPVTGVDLKAKCVNHSIFSGDKKIVTVSGTDYVEWSGGEMHRNLPSLKFYGDIVAQNIGSGYSYDNPRNLIYNQGAYRISSATSFADFVIPKLRRVGSYRDEWDYCNGNIKRHIKEIIFDGQGEFGEKVTNVLSQSGVYYATFDLIHPLVVRGVNAIISTHFKSTWSVQDGNMYANNVNSVYFIHKSLSTTDEWNAWFQSQYEAGSPVRLWYAMAEPIEEYQVGGNVMNDSGIVTFLDGTATNHPFELTYITHS